MWYPEAAARAGVAILHGLGGHSGQSTYAHLIEHLVPRGYAVYGLDLRGHGRSGGRRGSIEGWGDYRSDLQVFLEEIRKTEADSPIFLLGQSLGGLIVLEFALRYPREVQGVIASAPSLSTPNLSPLLIGLLKALSPIWPHLTLSPKLDAAVVSRDPEEVKKLAEDPLTDPKLSPRLVAETLATMQWVQDHAAEFQVPLLLIHGTADRLSSPEGSQTFFERVATEDKVLKLYEGGYHQAFIDTNREQVLADIAGWLGQHT
jgi:alpha-beta hydrolase superfamily lysophospholipase